MGVSLFIFSFNEGMKKGLFRGVIFLLIVVFADQFIGSLLQKLYFTSNSNSLLKINYSIDSTSQAILIYGSSRAQSHYNTDTIINHTGISCYNCGVGGQGLAFSLIQISEMLKRHKPELILLDISPNILFDYRSNEKLNILMPYYERDSLIQKILTADSKLEKIKYCSSIYPYNGSILPILKSIFCRDIDNNKGFIPLIGQIDTSDLKIDFYIQTKIPYEQIYYLLHILETCEEKKVRIKLVVSPIFRKSNDEEIILTQIKEIAVKNRIDFIDYSSDSSFSAKPELFMDNLHLNSFGAALFSKRIAKEILY